MTGYDVHDDNSKELKAAYPHGYFTNVITEKAEEIIGNHKNDRPLFLEIAHLAGHASEAEDPLEVPDVRQVNTEFSYITDVNRRKYAGKLSNNNN